MSANQIQQAGSRFRAEAEEDILNGLLDGVDPVAEYNRTVGLLRFAARAAELRRPEAAPNVRDLEVASVT